MNARERVLMAMRREGKPDRMPFEISWGAFTPSLMNTFREKTGTKLSPEEYFDFDVRVVTLKPTKVKRNFQKYFSKTLPSDIVFDEFGSGGKPGKKEHFLEFSFHPLENASRVEDVRNYEWPDIDADYRYEGIQEIVKDYKKRGYVVAADMYCTIFETAWMLRGMEKLMMDFYDYPELVHEICEQITRLRIVQARKYAEAGVDIIRLGDDIATQLAPMMSPKIYEEFFKQRMTRIVTAGKSVNSEVLYFMHSCGKIESLIPQFIEEGIDILNPIQPECNNLSNIADKYGNQISFWGGIGTQSTMPFGTPVEVKEMVKEVQNTLGKNGNVLIAPSHILEPEVPWENVEAFIEAAKESYY